MSGSYFPLMKRSIAQLAALICLIGFFSGPNALSSPMSDALTGKLVSLQGKTVKKFEDAPLGNVKYLAIYFSASWCPPCKGFTPDLVKWYQETKPKNPQFELVFVSRDRSEDDMEDYIKTDSMPWPSLAYRKIEDATEITKLAGKGIPCLVLIDQDGKVLSHSYEGATYVGPRKVLQDIDRVLAENPSTNTTASTAAPTTTTVGSGKFDIFADKK